MTHVRTQIRDGIVALLTGLALTGARVFPGRTRPLEKGHQPTLLVYTVSEVSDYDTMGGKLMRELTVMVEGRVTLAGIPDDVLDQIAEQVEPAMVADPSLGGLVQEVLLTATKINIEAPGDMHVGEIILTYRVRYRTLESAPGAKV